MRRLDIRLAGLVGFCLVTLCGAILLFGPFTSQAVQSPSIGLDMVTTGNTYDDTTNTMIAGAIDNCLASASANPATHTHSAQLVIQNVEDLIGWQVRFNYIGDRMRPATVNFAPFTDNNTGQNISFVNLPLDAGVHRDQISATNIPPPGAGPQSALVGAVYNGAQTSPVSPDTPAKAVPDDTTYSAPSGGVLASVNLQVVGDQTGQASLSMDLDDDNPTPPGSAVVVFDPAGAVMINLAENELGDGFHAEGAATCDIPTPPPPTPTPPSPTPTPGGPPGPANDDFPGSVIGNIPFTATQNTATATLESQEPTPCAPFAATVWYSFTPSEDMSIAADTFGSDFDTVLAAYTGTSLFTLTPVACNDQFQGNQSRITFSAIAGATYYFQVGGFLGQTGNLVFNVDVGPPPFEITVSIASTGSVIPRDGTAAVGGTVTCSKPSLVQLSGELRQRSGRATISGFFFTLSPCQGEAFWRAEVDGENGPFAGGRADLSVSAFAFAEGEVDFAEASGTVLLKGTRPPAAARCPRTGNDGFELGVVDTNVIPCWTVVDQEGGFGSWCNQRGTLPPQGDCVGGLFSVAAPPGGLQAAMTNQGGPGSHVLYRCGVLRSGQIGFQLQINNQAFAFFSPPSLDFEVFPNQQFRADLLTAAGVAANPFTVAPADILVNLYQTLPGDPPSSGYGSVAADASAYVGQEVCLRFAEVDNIFFFSVGIDDVNIDLRRRR